jgi:hypothetical protein
MRTIIIASSFLFFIFVTGVKSEEVYLNCVHKINTTTEISLSYNAKDNTGKEYVGQGLSINYNLDLTKTDITLVSKYEGKLIRSWNINRYNGDAQLFDSMGSSKTHPYLCSKVSRKL